MIGFLRIFFYTLCVWHTQYEFTFVTICFQLVLYTLRAPYTQERFTDVLGRCVLFYLLNRMGHA